VFSYIKAHTDKFQMIWENHVEWDKFWCLNQAHIRNKFWAYKQIHHWKNPCVLSSGAPGDEYMLRSPTTANLWLKYQGTSILEELSKNHCHLHRDYFNLPKHVDIFKFQDSHAPELSLNKGDFYHFLCNTVSNDFQHWHLGNTITFTPLRDLEIFKKFLCLSAEDGLSQILDSSISKELISRNDPTLLDYLSDVKNTGESFSNLLGLMSRYPAISGQ